MTKAADSAFDFLNDETGSPAIDFGTREPQFGTSISNFGDEGTDDILGGEGDANDQEIIENRQHLNFGGDVPDYGAGDEKYDFGDDIPGTNEIMGDKLSASAFSKKMAAYDARRASAHAPLIGEVVAPVAERDWEINFGPVFAPAGATPTIVVSPQCLFRGEKVMATDTGSPAGSATRILQVVIGQKIQKPGSGNGTLTQFFSQTALANGIRFDTAQRWSTISVTVSFIQTGTFDMSVFGRAVVD